MFKELLKFMKYDKLVAEDEKPASENIENEAVDDAMVTIHVMV